MSSFQQDIAGGNGNLIIAQLQSPNFSVSGKTGWAIMQNGDAYFYDITAEGSVTSNTVVVSGSGEGVFVYSGTPGAGNLIFSVCSASTTADSFGNTIPAGGAISYSGSGTAWSATGLSGGFVSYWTATSASGTWTFQGQLEYGSGNFIIDFDDTIVDGNLIVEGTMTCDSTLEATNGITVYPGNIDLSMGVPTNYPLPTSGGTTQVNEACACLNALITEMINRGLIS